MQRIDGYLADFNTFAHKETNSGCEGWLDVSLNNGDLFASTVTLQYPIPRLRIVVEIAWATQHLP